MMLFVVGFVHADDASRARENFDLGWTFTKGEPAGAEAPDVNSPRVTDVYDEGVPPVD